MTRRQGEREGRGRCRELRNVRSGRNVRNLRNLILLPVALLALSSGCADSSRRGAVWDGTIDTLPSGQVAVTNPPEPLRDAGAEEGWTVTEDLRIGTLDDPGPYEFGQVTALDVDALGRIWVLEAQAKEIRVFDAEGRHVRTVGRAGGGPGEFGGPAHAAFGPAGRLWVPDPQNNRISIIDTAGAFVASHRIEGGFFMTPWPGGFDDSGRYYLPVPRMGEDGFGIGVVRYEATESGLTPLDTLSVPQDPEEREHFELTSGDGGMRLMSAIPFAPGFRSFLSPRGTMWGLLTGEFRMFELDANGDTLRTISTPYDPLPVTAADRQAARESLNWFTEQGGKIDLSRIPDTKPAAESLFVDDEGRIWVDRLTENPEGQEYDLFDAEGRFLGRVSLPVPVPRVRLVRDGFLYGVTQDELGVPYVVRLRIDRGT